MQATLVDCGKRQLSRVDLVQYYAGPAREDSLDDQVKAKPTLRGGTIEVSDLSLGVAIG